MTHTDDRYQHASGDDDAGCVSCQVDAMLDGGDAEGCTWPVADPDEPALCLHCSHTIERLA